MILEVLPSILNGFGFKVFFIWVFPIVSGVVAIYFAIIKHRELNRRIGESAIIPGEVESLENPDETYIPWVVVQLPGEEPERFRANSGSDPPTYKVGQKVEVYYNPDADSKFMLRGKFEQWGLIGVLYFFGFWGLMTPLIWEWLVPLLLGRDHPFTMR